MEKDFKKWLDKVKVLAATEDFEITINENREYWEIRFNEECTPEIALMLDC